LNATFACQFDALETLCILARHEISSTKSQNKAIADVNKYCVENLLSVKYLLPLMRYRLDSMRSFFCSSLFGISPSFHYKKLKNTFTRDEMKMEKISDVKIC
jgi:hypothetical protein